ncbi:dihydrolipoamide acetyltransferase family protein [Promicromonospora soli]|uniref:Dihydrolipoamide acetyltransferase component of pyruvate dehydrogenase complex n=1 Tax=Promicromonospora soli TaxID=2035533 RepID=A0A919FWI8_9MICO|nr:dihydrolipoamide acetyltransferase family protein [Promicromonospora soli]GHH73081.1 dihydrolipoamide acetyltransferase component of pyruvate dehydrogenase complex [Promicromonospora soli]
MTSAATQQTFLLPDLGEGLTEAEVVQWLVAEGDLVAADQPVAEVETAKSVVEVPSPYSGRVLTLHAAEGETVEVGKPLITIVAESAGAAEPEPEQAGSGNVLIGYGTSAPGEPGRRRPRGAQPAPAAAAPDNRPVKVISPIVRRLAQEAGLDLRAIRPTGTGGVVTRSDVQTALESARPAPVPAPAAAPAAAPGERRIPLNGFRKAASAVLSRSRAEIPEATVWVDVDATALWDLREAARTATDPGPGLLAYLARFVVAGLKAYPVLNSQLDVERDEIVVPDVVNLGIAVQGEHGLVVPAVLGADSMTTAGLDAAIRDLTARARVGKATAEELAAGTFTLNNYGSLGVDGSAAIINHPQVAMIGFGRIIDRPWVVDGQIVARKITQMSFVFDHRVCDGGTAAGFMRSVADAIENPASAIVRL